MKVVGRGCARECGTAAVEASVFARVCEIARQALYIRLYPKRFDENCVSSFDSGGRVSACLSLVSKVFFSTLYSLLSILYHSIFSILPNKSQSLPSKKPNVDGYIYKQYVCSKGVGGKFFFT